MSLFVDAEPDPIRWAAGNGADRVELYTEPFARAYEQGDLAAKASFDRYAQAAELAASLGLGVNAGHDLDLDNLRLFRTVAAPGRGVDRACPHQPRPLRRALIAPCVITSRPWAALQAGRPG